MWVPLDVTKEAEWKRAIGEIESNFGPLDVCCNNAGGLLVNGEGNSIGEVEWLGLD